VIILQSIILGIPQGALYGLMGFGIALIFRSVGIINFGHGHAAMISVFIAFTVFSATQNYLLALVCGVCSGFIFGLLIDRVLMRPIKHISHGSMLMITLGLLMVFEGLAILVWGADYQIYPVIAKGVPYTVGEGLRRLVIPRNEIAITMIALVVSIILAFLLKYTKLGTAIRARGQDEIGARVVGIDTNRIDAIVWGIGIGLAVLVGVLAAPKSSVHPNMLINMQLYGITAGVLGGFGSLFGAIWGGLILGILEKLVGVYISPDYQISIIFLLIIVVLVIKPSGIFAGKGSGRV